MDDEDNYNRKKKIEISEELKKKILIDIINNCLGEKENYALFKYIYLMPARSLLYKNLYEEIMLYLKEDKSLNLEKFKEKEQKFIKNIEKEIEISIEKAKKKSKKSSSEYSYNFDEDRNDNDDEEDLYRNDPPISEEFKCFDKNIKKFIGFNSDIIPGEIVREEIVQIATSNSLAMYRLIYYTKYFKVEELRKNLLNNKDKKNENEESKEKKGEDQKTDNKEEEKKEENKEKEKKEEEKKENKNKKEKQEEKKEDKEKEKVEKDKSNEEENKKKGEDEASEESEKEESEKKDNKEEEITETEITNKLELKNRTKKYDISEKNENSFIYTSFPNRVDAYILEDKTIKNKNKVKITLIRFIFANSGERNKNFRAKIKEVKTISSIESVNQFNPKFVNDIVEENNISNFHSIYRLRGDLPFVKDENMGVTIDFNDN